MTRLMMPITNRISISVKPGALSEQERRVPLVGLTTSVELGTGRPLRRHSQPFERRTGPQADQWHPTEYVGQSTGCRLVSFMRPSLLIVGANVVAVVPELVGPGGNQHRRPARPGGDLVVYGVAEGIHNDRIGS